MARSCPRGWPGFWAAPATWPRGRAQDAGLEPGVLRESCSSQHPTHRPLTLAAAPMRCASSKARRGSGTPLPGSWSTRCRMGAPRVLLLSAERPGHPPVHGCCRCRVCRGVCRCCIPTRHCGVHCDGVLQRPKSQTGLGHAPKGSRHDRSPRLHPSGIWGVPPVFPLTFFPLRLGGGGNVCLQEAGLWLNSPPVGDPV